MNKPKIFISWSGKDTASFRVASKLYEIMPLMFQTADYFFSDHITKGKLGIEKIFANLAEAKIGIFCITKNNLLKPWLNFEAGAILSAVQNNNGLAIPLLINMNTDDFLSFSSPLTNFQGTVFKDENDLRRMIQDIGDSIKSNLSEKQLDNLFAIHKTQFYDCDIDDKPLSNADNSSPVISVQPDTTMTKECNRFFKLLFREYLCRRKKGETKSKAIHFKTSAIVSELLKVPFADAEYFTRELGNMGYLNYEVTDTMVFSIVLTEKGIKYGKDNFDESAHITALRIILSEYNPRRCEDVYVGGFMHCCDGVSKSDISILKDMLYIKVISESPDDLFCVRPTAKALELE